MFAAVDAINSTKAALLMVGDVIGVNPVGVLILTGCRAGNLDIRHSDGDTSFPTAREVDMQNEHWVCPNHGPLRPLISKKTGVIYRWCPECGVDPVARIFELERELAEARKKQK